jgi:hypothetical protein
MGLNRLYQGGLELTVGLYGSGKRDKSEMKKK